MSERLGAVLSPWRCSGTLRSGHPCNKLLAEVDLARPIFVKVRCGRCGHENVLVERYSPLQSAQEGPERAFGVKSV